MKKSNLACRIICAATATAMFALPLLACTDDELHGVEVTEKQWNERAISIILCKNNTDSNKEYVNDKLTAHTVIKYAIDSGVISVSNELTSDTAYWFLKRVEDYTDYWCIKIEKETDGQWQVNTSRMYADEHIKLLVERSMMATAIFAGKISKAYSRFTFKEETGAYISKDSTTTMKAYFSDKYLFGFDYSYKSDDGTMQYTSRCSDFGKTTVKVPADVKALADEYIATHEPPVEDEW